MFSPYSPASLPSAICCCCCCKSAFLARMSCVVLPAARAAPSAPAVCAAGSPARLLVRSARNRASSALDPLLALLASCARVCFCARFCGPNPGAPPVAQRFSVGVIVLSSLPAAPAAVPVAAARLLTLPSEALVSAGLVEPINELKNPIRYLPLTGSQGSRLAPKMACFSANQLPLLPSTEKLKNMAFPVSLIGTLVSSKGGLSSPKGGWVLA